MEKSSPEIKLIPEIKSTPRLTSENVAIVYQDTISRYGNNRVFVKDLINEASFDSFRLEENRQTIEQFANQLLPRFRKVETGGANYLDAQEDQYYNQWAKSSQEVRNLLALISAIGLGRVTTSREVIKYAKTKDKNKIYYLLDYDLYAKSHKE